MGSIYSLYEETGMSRAQLLDLSRLGKITIEDIKKREIEKMSPEEYRKHIFGEDNG